jgi:hypothetical protein
VEKRKLHLLDGRGVFIEAERTAVCSEDANGPEAVIAANTMGPEWEQSLSGGDGANPGRGAWGRFN